MQDFCPHCGAKHTAPISNERQCSACGGVTYRNPIPVGIGLVPVRRGRKTGLLIIQRGVEPQRGGWALPGGHLEWGEQIEDGIAREVQEETGVKIGPKKIELTRTVSNPRGSHILIFGYHNEVLPSDSIKHFTPNEEILAVDVLCLGWMRTLCFPLHQEEMLNTLPWLPEGNRLLDQIKSNVERAWSLMRRD